MTNREIKVGADPFPPYQYYEADGSPEGSDYRQVRKLFEAMGYEISMTIREWSKIQAMMDEGLLDAAFQVQKTPERIAKYAFSELFRQAETQVVSANNQLCLNGFSDIPDQHLSIGLIKGYVNDEEIDSLPPANKKFYLGTVALLQGISMGEVDVGVFDKGVKEYLMDKHSIENIYVLDNLTFFRPLHVIFNDPFLRDEFDWALAVQ